MVASRLRQELFDLPDDHLELFSALPRFWAIVCELLQHTVEFAFVGPLFVQQGVCKPLSVSHGYVSEMMQQLRINYRAVRHLLR